MAARAPRNGFLARLAAAGGALVSRDIAVLTNAIAFNFLVCLFPLLLALAGASQRLGATRTGTALVVVLQELIPFGHDHLVESVRNLSKMARGLELFSIVLIVWGSSGIFMPVEMVLNRVWGGKPNRHFVLSRGLAFLMTLAGGLAVLGSVALTSIARTYGSLLPGLARWGARASAVAMMYLLFLLIYRFIPASPVGLRVASRAALWAAGGWELAKYAFVWNLGRLDLMTTYGPLTFAVTLVLWAYVSSLVLAFGALMTPVRGRG